jgi:tetratricopeptide (TPR) repeat protein
MTGLLQDALTALALAAAVCAIALVVMAVAGFLAAAWRVGLRGRVLVVPFQGTDDRRSALTGLFARRLMEIEERWTELAHQIEELKRRFDDQSAPVAPATAETDETPLTSGRRMPLESPDGQTGGPSLTVAGPRTTGDDFLDDILLLEDNPITTADLGVISVGGVAFSPQHILALSRRLPEVFARRVLSGTMVKTGDDYVLSVLYEERPFRRPRRRVRRVTTVEGEDWLGAIERLGFELAKGRIDLLREARGRRKDARRAVITGGGSVMADRAVVEARSWEACEAFLVGYVSHVEHYVCGEGEPRERALRCYERALRAEPGYTRADYHRAALLYNRYRPDANEQAIAGFEAAAASEDLRLRALAFAGAAMGYCQATHRFGRDRGEVIGKAMQASEDAVKLDPKLEEALTARAWAYQLQESWDEAIAQYLAVAELGGRSSPARRMASFARNNAAWLWLEPLREREGSLQQAERLLWQAVSEYPNKVVYANLAEVARRLKRYDDAVTLFAHAVALDPTYVSGWNELACLELEIAGLARSRGDTAAYRSAASEALGHHQRAVGLAGDTEYVGKLRAAFDAARREHECFDEPLGALGDGHAGQPAPVTRAL